MPFKKNNDRGELFKGVLLTHVILFLHLLFIALLGLLVIFFRGVTHYMLWILLGSITVILLSIYFFYRRIKSKGKQTLQEMNTSPLFKGRSVEVSFLGGIASVKFGRENNPPALEGATNHQTLQLEDPTTARIRELNELTQLFEKKLITLEEFNHLKKQVLKND